MRLKKRNRMVLNYIWVGFFLIAFVVALGRLLLFGDMEVFTDIINSTFSSAKLGFEISIGLTGVLAMWLGIMRIGEKGGVINLFAKFSAPLFGKLFPEIPKGHPVIGRMFMNFSANLLGLDNAATPIGLNVMQQLQSLNPNKDTASNPMIMFLAINASGLTLIPLTIIMYRLQLGAQNPADIFIPILLTTFVSTLVAVTLVGIRQRINIFDRAILIPLGVITVFISVLLLLINNVAQESMSRYATIISNVLLFGIICGFIVCGLYKKINVYESFIEGAKDGFKTAVTIIPYLIAILVGVAVFRASGAMSFIIDGIAYVVEFFGFNSDFIGALPTMIMKPLSGSGSRGMMIDAMNTYGADSFVGRLSSIVQGSTDTTFYVIALYYGSVAIRKTRYTLGYSLIADLAGILTAITLAYIFFS